ALAAFRKLGAAHPRDPRVLQGWAAAAVKTRGWGEALRVAVTWASIDDSAAAQLHLARLQRAAGQRYGAVATLTRLLDRDPDQAEAREMLARLADAKLAAR
ncbi:MAG: tetratricopeptide repeat protein, partial [Deltaproteobacteria bacterium]|nr:tetratricopeptide repeat protein [Deltaproteobacteria bacterium]